MLRHNKSKEIAIIQEEVTIQPLSCFYQVDVQLFEFSLRRLVFFFFYVSFMKHFGRSIVLSQ